jgi:hypothetical protein
MSVSQARSPDSGHRRKDPYEAYYRHERRQHRLRIAMVVGAFFLALLLVLGALFFSQLAYEAHVASINTHSTASN